MTEERKIQLAVEVDGTGAKKGFDQVKQEAQSMAKAVGQSGAEAGKAIDGIGAGGGQSAQKVDAATKSMIGSIQRTTAVMEAGSRTGSKYFEVLAAQRGIPVDALKPYLAQLDAVAAKQAQATGALNAGAASLNNVGISAAQTAAALRGVPAQFTDIIASLEGGQKPITVLLQQGGQLKDMFGGAGNAAKALGGYVLGLINPFTIAAAAVGGLAIAYYEGGKESEAYTKALILTGNAAGTTAAQLGDMAERISKANSGITKGASAAVLTEFAASGQIAADQFEQFAVTAVNLEKEAGIAVKDTVKQFVELGKDPVAASLKLNETTNYLTKSIYEQIKALADQGKAAEAAALAQKAYNDAIGERIPQLTENLGIAEKAWRGLTGAAKSAWDAMLDIGRKADPATEIKKQIDFVQQELARVKGIGDRDPTRNTGPTTARLNAELAALNAQVGALNAVTEAKKKDAEASAAQAKNVAAKALWDKAGEQFLSKSATMEREVTKARNEGAAAGVAQADIEKRVGEIREKYKETHTGNIELANIKARTIAETQYLEQLNLRGSAADKLNDGEKLVLQYTEQLKGKLDAKTRSEKEADLVAANALATVLRQVDAKKELLKSQDEFEKARDKELKSYSAEIVAIGNKAQAIEDEIAMYGLSKQAIESLANARLNEKRAALLQFEGSADQIALLDQEVEARQRLAKAQDNLVAASGAKQLREENLKFTASAIGDEQTRAEALLKIDADVWREKIANATAGSEAQKQLQTQFDEWLASRTGQIKDNALNKTFNDFSTAAQKLAGTMEGLFGRVGKGVAGVTAAMVDGARKQIEIARRLESEKKAVGTGPEADKKLIEANRRASEDSAKAQIGQYADMAGAAKGFFAEGSKGYKALEAAEGAFRAYQLASDIVKGVSAAAVAVANQAQGDPYTAWFRMAAMAATMAALGFAVSGGSGSDVDIAKERQKTQGTGTVLGDDGAKSESISHAIDLLADNSNIALKYSSGMLSALHSIKDGIAGMAAFVSQSSGLRGTTADQRGLGVGSSKSFLGFSSESRELVDSGIIFDRVQTAADKSAYADALAAYTKDRAAYDAEMAAAYTGDVYRAWAYAGSGPQRPEMQTSSQTIGSVLAGGVGAKGYADIHSESSSFWGLFGDSSDDTQLKELGADLKLQFAKTVQSMYSGVLSAAGALGQDSSLWESVLKSVSFEQAGLDRISLKGLSGADIEKELQAAFSKLGDTMAAAVMPELAVFQKVGEGMFETLVRVASGADSAKFELEKLGIAAIDYTGIANKQGDIATEIVRDSILAVESGEGISEMLRTLSGSAEDLIGTYKDLAEVQRLLAATGLNSANLSRDTVRGAGGLDELKSGAETYFKEFFTEAQQRAADIAKLTSEFSALGLALPTSRDGFKNLVARLDDGTEAGNRLVGKMLSLSGAFAEVYKSAEELQKAALDGAMSGLEKAVNAQKAILQSAYEAQAKAMQEQAKAASTSLQSIQSVFNALNSSLQNLQPLSRGAAQDVLNSALSTSNAGGSLANFPGLTEALQAVAKPSESMFATFIDYQRDRLLTAGTISALKENAGAQVSVAEMTLNAINDSIKTLEENHTSDIAHLDAIISSAQAQIDAINGVNASVLTIPEALREFAAALSAASAAKAQVGGNSIGASSGASTAVALAQPEAVASYGKQYGGDSYYMIPGVNDYASKLENIQDVASKTGVSVADVFKSVTGHSQSYWEEVQRQFDAGLHPTTTSIRGFAVGTNYVPHDMTANIHEGERIIPKADNAALMDALRNPHASSEALCAEVRALREEVAALRIANSAENQSLAHHANKTAKALERAMPDGDAIATRAAT